MKISSLILPFTAKVSGYLFFKSRSTFFPSCQDVSCLNIKGKYIIF